MAQISLNNVKWIQGGPVNITPGSVFVVELWATWCPPCRTAIPHLSELAKRYKGKVEFTGLTNETDTEKIRNFVQQMGSQMSYNVGITSDIYTDLMRRYGVEGIPHAFLIDHKGNVAWHGHPMDPEFENKLQSCVNNASSAAIQKNWTNLTIEELQNLSVKDLKNILAEKNQSSEGCIEKGDLIERILGSK